MCKYCLMVPRDVLKRLSQDQSLSPDVRRGLEQTAMLDLEIRKFREQARKVTFTAQKIAPLSLVAVPGVPAVQVYDCQNGTTLPGNLVANPAGSADATAKAAFTETTALAQFYSQLFGRNSIDNAGMTLVSSIHFGTGYNNAFWNGTQMTYGDGNGSIFVDFTKGNDVIAHENTHGVTQHTMQLAYANESGGLNESISDVFGSMFRQWRGNQEVTKADWLIGKDIMGPEALQRGFTCLRDMSDPAATHCLAPQISHFSQYRPRMDPHFSSGVPNLAFHAAAMAIGGKSWEKAGQIWYQAITRYGASPNLKMAAFATRTRKEAARLFAGQAAILNAVDAAWKKVGL